MNIIYLTEDKLDKSIALPDSTLAGAKVRFDGIVRGYLGDKQVLRLEFEAYESMALKVLNTIVTEAEVKWSLHQILVVHRTGNVLAGEIAVIIEVVSQHRKEAFAACQYLIDELKSRVPIWKREVYEDGSSWVSAHP